MRYEGGQYYLKSEEEMQKVFPYAREAMDNTHKIAERCNVEIVFGEQKVPKFDVPEGYDAFSYLKELCETGLVKRYGDPPPQELQERLSYELSTIKNMGYVDYFLIVWDFIRFAKSQESLLARDEEVRQEVLFPIVLRLRISTQSDISLFLSVS